MKDGSRSDLPQNSKNGGSNWSEVKIQPEGVIVKRIAVSLYGKREFDGAEFYDQDGNKILKVGSFIFNKSEK